LILAEQLEDDPDNNMSDTQVEYASVILSSGKDLLTLLNGILELAKVESGTVTVEMTDVPLHQLRRSLMRDFEQVVESKGLGFSIEMAHDVPETIVTDSQRLGQILKNLLANAFKFTERGEVQMKVGLAADGWGAEAAALNEASSVLAISVRDTGIGIDKEHEQRIFEAFVQGDGTTARLYGGTGLGLSISRELAGLLDGEITVRSVPDHGSTFTVFLPLRTPVAAEPGSFSADLTPAADGTEPPVAWVGPRGQLPTGSQQHPDEIRSLEGINVLVVDDDFRNVFALTALLERCDAEVTSAENGPDAIAAIKQMPNVDVVLMDIMMPVMDGYAVMRTVRALDEFKSLPIIAVTAKVVAGERDRCLAAGASDYFPKPVNTAELLAVMAPWLPVRTGPAL